MRPDFERRQTGRLEPHFPALRLGVGGFLAFSGISAAGTTETAPTDFPDDFQQCFDTRLTRAVLSFQIVNWQVVAASAVPIDTYRAQNRDACFIIPSRYYRLSWFRLLWLWKGGEGNPRSCFPVGIIDSCVFNPRKSIANGPFFINIVFTPPVIRALSIG